MIAPNNNLPATHFIEVFSNGITTNQQDSVKNFKWDDCFKIYKINRLEYELEKTLDTPHLKTIFLFKIRLNQLPTKHRFK